ncbi:hypothetical protein [Vibrio alginolyticus]|uniref:hypothetical protein n=1 Tax=Vibrio alginolyticus TaxID=663 RepID=UPI0013035EA1|nr:hypothetical protein [Vibrio alginolyticus]MBS9919998.1 hypothetical protein [Vibrio alginolyticus]
MSKKVKLGVVSALSVAVLVGCQTTSEQIQAPPEYRGGVSQTSDVNLLRYSDTVKISVYQVDGVDDYSFWEDVSKAFSLTQPIFFDLPLTEVVDCSHYNQFLDGKYGKLVITNIDNLDTDVHRLTLKGHVTTEQFDISQCQATLEFIVDDYSKKGLISKIVKNADKVREYSPQFDSLIVPEIKALKEQAILSEYKKVADERKLRKLSSWHINELSDTAQGIATIKVCMEKGTFFLPGDKRAKKVLRESESYVKNDIKSKIDGKHYWDQQSYNQAHQKGLNTARYLWQHDYLTFSNQCAAMRNMVDSITNK